MYISCGRKVCAHRDTAYDQWCILGKQLLLVFLDFRRQQLGEDLCVGVMVRCDVHAVQIQKSAQTLYLQFELSPYLLLHDQVVPWNRDVFRLGYQTGVCTLKQRLSSRCFQNIAGIIRMESGVCEEEAWGPRAVGLVVVFLLQWWKLQRLIITFIT